MNEPPMNTKTTAQLKNIEELLTGIQSQLALWLKEHKISQPYFIGIHTGGAWLAEHLHKALAIQSELGKLDISFYRDDFEQKGLHPEVKPSELSLSVEDANIILIDDVLMTGRTIRAAFNEIFDYGRPASVTLVTLIELTPRQLPIRADICGQKLSLPPSQRVNLSGPEPLKLEIISKDSERWVIWSNSNAYDWFLNLIFKYLRWSSIKTAALN